MKDKNKQYIKELESQLKKQEKEFELYAFKKLIKGAKYQNSKKIWHQTVLEIAQKNKGAITKTCRVFGYISNRITNTHVTVVSQFNRLY